MPFKTPSLIFYFKPVIIQTGYNNLFVNAKNYG